MRTVILGLRRGLGFLAVTLVVALLQAQAALAQRAGDWVELGRQPVGIGLDKDVIQLDRADGRFDGLKLRVENGNVLLLGINVVFGNGDRQDIPVTGLMRSGQETTTLDLDGGRRFIDRIELQYGTLGLGGRRPVVIVMGRVGARPARPADVATVEPGWQDGGSEALNRRGGVVTFQVGRRAGWLEAIALTAQGVDIPIEQVEVVYANDDRERLRAPRTIQRRQSTGPLELRDGNGGRVDSVRVTYGRFQPGNRDVALQLSLLPGEQPAPERFTDLGDEWVSLGRQRVEQRGDSDVITVGPREGRFDALVLRVRRSPIRLRSVTVVYGNGEREEVSTPVRIDAGADSEIFELADYSGRGRVISEIRLSYGTRDGNRPAIVEVFAHKAPEERFADLGDEWQSLGRERVEQRGDSAVISVGRGEGRFDALVLRVRRSPIRLRSVTVVYGNGEREEVSTPVRIDAGADSEIFELADTDGRGRVIREIRLSYGTRDGNRPAIVEVFAHKAPEERFTDLGNDWVSLGRQRVDQRGDA
ncbi:MAG: hypothetical protein GC150_09825, partial [Rhizobiales bacterium]|nr:hypothetical protein [Hyphomicrobiales bacterium]